MAATARKVRKAMVVGGRDRKSTRLNSSHTVIYTLSLHDALPIFVGIVGFSLLWAPGCGSSQDGGNGKKGKKGDGGGGERSEEHTSELQSHRDLHSFPTRRSSDLCRDSWLLAPLGAGLRQ